MSLELDDSTRQRLKLVYPDIRVRWIRLANDMYEAHDLCLKVAQGLRTYDEQAAIYAKGRTLVNGKLEPELPSDPYPRTGVVTWAKPGDSWHHFSALDSCFAGSDPYLEKAGDEGLHIWDDYARLAKAHGFEAGADWVGPKKDRPHVQIRYGGMKLARAKELYTIGKLGAVWSEFDRIRGVERGEGWDNLETMQRLRVLGVML